MFEVVPSLSRKRAVSPHAALAAAALLAGCGGAPPEPAAPIPPESREPAPAISARGDVPPGPTPGPEAPGLNVIERACVIGTWVTAPVACACPTKGAAEYTPECAAKDCLQTDVLLLREGGKAIRAAVRFSANTHTLSAPSGKATTGEWKYFDSAELMTKFEGNAKYTPTECKDNQLIPKAEAPLSKPHPDLQAAITWAAWNNVWTSVPYAP